MSETASPAILIFDSGVGGLSVYQEIRQQLPRANYIYLFDNQAYPYGELERDTLIDRVEKLIKKVTQVHKVDIVVIACNTASTIVLPTLRSTLSIPVVGVVPAIKPASLVAKKAVGLIATPATVKREYTFDLINEFAADIPVRLLGSTELVDIAERKLRGEPVIEAELQNVLEPLIGKIDVAVLGCTHFPLLKEEIMHVLKGEVALIDSGKAIANRVVSVLQKANRIGVSEIETDNLAYSSAAPVKETALKLTFRNMGFKTIERIQIQDA